MLRCCYALFVGFLAAAVRTNTRLRTLVNVVPGVWGGAGAGAQRSGQAAHCGDEGWARFDVGVTGFPQIEPPANARKQPGRQAGVRACFPGRAGWARQLAAVPSAGTHSAVQ